MHLSGMPIQYRVDYERKRSCPLCSISEGPSGSALKTPMTSCPSTHQAQDSAGHGMVWPGRHVGELTRKTPWQAAGTRGRPGNRRSGGSSRTMTRGRAGCCWHCTAVIHSRPAHRPRGPSQPRQKRPRLVTRKLRSEKDSREPRRSCAMSESGQAGESGESLSCGFRQILPEEGGGLGLEERAPVGSLDRPRGLQGRA